MYIYLYDIVIQRSGGKKKTRKKKRNSYQLSDVY